MFNQGESLPAGNYSAGAGYGIDAVWYQEGGGGGLYSGAAANLIELQEEKNTGEGETLPLFLFPAGSLPITELDFLMLW